MRICSCGLLENTNMWMYSLCSVHGKRIVEVIGTYRHWPFARMRLASMNADFGPLNREDHGQLIIIIVTRSEDPLPIGEL